MGFKFEVDKLEFDELVKRVKGNIGAVGQTKILDSVAAKAHVGIVERTPIRTGDTRRHWFIRGLGAAGVREIYNNSIVALYLEEGTRAHGPVVANRLYFRGSNGRVISKYWVSGIEARHIIKDFLPEISETLVNTLLAACFTIDK
jgi:hypothetical protein